MTTMLDFKNFAVFTVDISSVEQKNSQEGTTYANASATLLMAKGDPMPVRIIALGSIAASIATGQSTLVGRIGYDEKEGTGTIVFFPAKVERAPSDGKLRNYVCLTLRVGKDSDCRYSDAGKFWGRVRMALSQGKDSSGNYKPSLWLTVKGFTSREAMKRSRRPCLSCEKATWQPLPAGWPTRSPPPMARATSTWWLTKWKRFKLSSPKPSPSRTALSNRTHAALAAAITVIPYEARTLLRASFFSLEAIAMKTTIEQQDTRDISAFRLKCDPLALQEAMVDVEVSITGYFYAVDFGPRVYPQQHRVGKNAICTCYLGEFCSAVDVVRIYLADGGERAPDPLPGFYPVIPSLCPICHARVAYDAKLSSKHRGAGWRCETGGSAHYWQCIGQASASKSARKRAIQQGLPAPEPLPAESW